MLKESAGGLQRPTSKPRAVIRVINAFEVSERLACRLGGYLGLLSAGRSKRKALIARMGHCGRGCLTRQASTPGGISASLC